MCKENRDLRIKSNQIEMRYSEFSKNQEIDEMLKEAQFDSVGLIERKLKDKKKQCKSLTVDKQVLLSQLKTLAQEMARTISRQEDKIKLLETHMAQQLANYNHRLDMIVQKWSLLFSLSQRSYFIQQMAMNKGY